MRSSGLLILAAAISFIALGVFAQTVSPGGMSLGTPGGVGAPAGIGAPAIKLNAPASLTPGKLLDSSQATNPSLARPPQRLEQDPNAPGGTGTGPIQLPNDDRGTGGFGGNGGGDTGASGGSGGFGPDGAGGGIRSPFDGGLTRR